MAGLFGVWKGMSVGFGMVRNYVWMLGRSGYGRLMEYKQD